MRLPTWILLFLVLVALLLGVYAFGGYYDVAATKPHPKLFEWAALAVVDASVKRHAPPAAAGPDLEAPERISAGFREYHEECEVCHAAPGVDPTDLGRGLYPPPPDLSRDAGDWSPEQLFWIVKNGLRDTGMPAFGPTHDDDHVWSIVAFTRQLPKLSAADYRDRVTRLGAAEEK
jgi:mono/diheme cytochrome c family protein